MSVARTWVATLAAALAIGCATGEKPAAPALAEGEGYVTVEGGRIWYRVVGTGPGTPLVVLHGGPGAPSYYLATLARLGTERPIIIYDQLGAGRADIPTDTTLWRIPRFMDEIDSLRAHLGLTEIHLLGHSWGTILGTEYVLARPTGVRSLILASPALSIPLWESDADSLIRTLPDSMQRAIAAAETTGAFEGAGWDTAVHEYYARFLSRVGGPDLDSTFAHFGAGLYGYMWGPSEFTAVGTLKGYDITPRLGELKLPVLYAMGEFDEILASTLESYRAATPGATAVIIPGSGHLMSIDAPEALNRELSTFLRRVEQP